MSATSPQKAFSKPVEYLNNCQLTSSVSSEEALKIAEILSNSEPWLTLKFSATSLSNYLMREDSSLRRFAIKIDEEFGNIENEAFKK